MTMTIYHLWKAHFANPKDASASGVCDGYLPQQNLAAASELPTEIIDVQAKTAGQFSTRRLL